MSAADEGRAMVQHAVYVAAVIATWGMSTCYPQAAEVTARLNVFDDAAKPVPCRVHLVGPDGKPVQPAGLPFWRDHFCCDGTVELSLPSGRYRYTVERGPEYESLAGDWEIVAGKEADLSLTLKRMVDLAAIGWHCADLHVHRPVDDVPLLMAAEDVNIAPVITWWNTKNQWSDVELPNSTIQRTPDGRFYDVMAGEDERGGGALLYFGLPKPLAIADAQREYPSSLTFLARAKRETPSVWIDIEKPFWRDVPLWLASGKVDSIGIAHNHMWRSGVLDNEAWGRPRDAQQWPGPQGNGRWTQEIYYHALNCGLRIPPSAGSASGVLPNPVGYNRCYVRCEPLSYAAWWDGLRAGRVFVTNGPLLLATTDEQPPGHVFKSAQEPLKLAIRGRIVSRELVAKIEVIQNGQVVDSLPGSDLQDFTFETQIDCARSSWFLVRAIADSADTFRFASTGPYYVEIGDQPRVVDRQSARFFHAWTEERRAELSNALDGPQRGAVLRDHDQAIAFWADLLRRAE
jgi:hypothetical protein